MRWMSSALSVVVLFAAMHVTARTSVACFGFVGPSTIASQYKKADAVILVEWTAAGEERGQTPEFTQFEYLRTLKGPANLGRTVSRIRLDEYNKGNEDSQFLLLGRTAKNGRGIDWYTAIEMSDASLTYVEQMPDVMLSDAKRVPYYFGHLESPDEIIAEDAYLTVSELPYVDLRRLAGSFPLARLRQWTENPKTAARRLGVYGVMLGFSGDRSDADRLKKRILADASKFRQGIEGLMSAYLLLAGEEGLEVLEQTRFQHSHVSFSETYAAMQAIRFMHTYGGNQISSERLCESMQILLDRPELADLVIADLGRWKDWTVQDRLMEIYRSPRFDVPAIKRSIAQYFLRAQADVPKGTRKSHRPQHAVNADDYLAHLQKTDPKTLQGARKFLFLN